MAEIEETKKKCGGRICAAGNCHNTYRNSSVSMFRFPQEAKRCHQWVINLRRVDLEQYSPQELYMNYQVCADHFEDSQFSNATKKNRLKVNAVPTLFDIPNPPPQSTIKRKLPTRVEKKPKVEVLTEEKVEGSATPTKERLKKQIASYRVKLWREKRKKERHPDLKRALLCLKQYVSSDIYAFVESQVQKSQKSKKAYRWQMKDKLLAMSIFFHSKKAYKILSKVFILPTIKTLVRDLQKMHVQPGFSESIFEALTLKVRSLQEKDKNVALIFDEMSIKEGLVYNTEYDNIEGFEDFGHIGKTKYIANPATVFMIRGMASKWKQPVGYFLSSGPISSSLLQILTRNCISKVKKTGLQVVALVCDQGSNNRSFLHQQEGVSADKPYITIEGKKVFVFYDPPHLLKNIRNNLKKQDLEFDGQRVRWQDIVDFYNLDKGQSIRMAPKLTDRHIDLPPFMSMRVKLAAQVLSHSVAAGISTLVTLKYLPPRSMHTAKFVELFDTLFNAFNSRSLRSSQMMGHAFSDTSGHHSFLRDTCQYLDKLKTAEGKQLPCILGWKVSINALLGLWHYLKTEASFDFILTSRLNQDCVENLFSIIRGRGRFNDNPDCCQFRSAFKFVIADKLFVQSDSSNCKVDSDQILLDIIAVATAKSTVPNVTAPERPLATAEMCSDGLPISLPSQNVVAYLAGYLLRKVPCDNCQMCSTKLCQLNLPPPTLEPSFYELLRKKNFREEGGLLNPTPLMQDFVLKLEDLFSSTFGWIIHMSAVISRLCNSAECHWPETGCNETDCKKKMGKMVRLYMRVRVFHALKQNNLANSMKGVKRNRKMLKLSHL